MWGVWKKGRSGQWERKEGLTDRAHRLYCLTGTPLPNGRPVEAYSMLNALGCSAATSRAKYIEAYCKRPNRFAPQGFDTLGAMNLDELNEKMAEVMIRFTPETCPGELPELIRVHVPLEGQDAEHEGIEIEIDGQGNCSFTRDGLPAFDEIARYRARLGEIKVPEVAQWIRDYVTDGNGGAKPIVVFVHHRAVACAIAAALPEEWCLVATGDDQPEIRQGKVDQFAQPNGPPVFIGTVGATGTGLNGLHRRTNVCVFGEGEWSPADLDQAEGRIRRLGSVAGTAVAYYLLVADSLEEHIIQTINAKREAIKIGVDGEATVRQAAAPIVPPPAPRLEPTVDWAAEELKSVPAALPEAHEVEWSFGRDRKGNWCARAAHAGADTWTGANVTLATKDGREKLVVLGKRVAGGADWSLWTFTVRNPNGAKARITRFGLRGAGRGVEGATDETPCSPADRPAILACIAAAERLCALDPDRAMEQNGVGWRSGDYTLGSMLRDLPAEEWTLGTWRTARALLGIYSKTQIADLWPAIKGR